MLAWVVLAYPVGALSAMALARIVGIVTGTDGGGMSVLGSVVGCVAFSFGYVRLVFHQPPWRLLDAVSFTFPLTLAIGRVGCMLNGCCSGTATTVRASWITVPVSAFAPGTDAARLHEGLSGAERCWNLPLLLAMWSVVALVGLELLFRARTRLRLRDGDLLAAWLVLDGVGRAPLEALRAAGGPWQGLSIGMACAGAAALAMSRLTARKSPS